jgi:hypothetical protein
MASIDKIRSNERFMGAYRGQKMVDGGKVDYSDITAGVERQRLTHRPQERPLTATGTSWKTPTSDFNST